MTIERPTDGYRGQMTLPPTAWPEADEDAHSQRSVDLKSTQAQLQEKLASWEQTKTKLFDGSTWFGNASDAAQQQVQSRISRMQSIDGILISAIAFHNNTSESIKNAKNHIKAISDLAQHAIDMVNSESANGDESARQSLIDQIVRLAFEANSDVVAAAGTAITAGQIYPAVEDKQLPDFGGIQGVRNQASGSSSAPTAPTQTTAPKNNAPSGAGSGEPAAAVPTETTATKGNSPNGTDGVGAPAPASSGTTASQNNSQNFLNNSSPGSVAPPSTASPPTPGGSGAPSVGGGIGGGSPGSPSGSPSSPLSGSGSGGGSPSSSTPATPASTPTDAKPKPTAGQGAGAGEQVGTGQAPANDFTKAMAEQSANAAQPPVSAASSTAPPVAPTPLAPPQVDAPEPAAAAHSSGSTGSGAGGSSSSGTGGGFSGGGSAGTPIAPPTSSAPMPPAMPLGPPSTPPPAAPVPPPSTPTGPGVNPASVRADAGAIGAAPVPVSAARAERDAILSASTAGAMQRKSNNGSAALIQARRIAAALNIGVLDYGFFWVTGLTADGSIVVANSFGLGYIPDGVQLPPQVTMATADETIPPADRAKWATYPILAIQGWAQSHSQKLRAVIATEEQFARFDPGAAKIVLRPDDIPETGKMQGRSRLEVIAPEAAARLASVSDAALVELLPPAPADTAAPEDRSTLLWFELTKPLMSTASDRGMAHLKAFVEYADHAQEQALYRAHTAVDAAAQRVAIADWVYWQHLSVLISDAIGAEAAV